MSPRSLRRSTSAYHVVSALNLARMGNLNQNAFVQVFDGPRSPLRPEQLALPKRLGEGEVLVEIGMATICGSDLHTFNGRRQVPIPSILGHEAVGRVVEVGGGREGLTRGDRITWSIADSCGSCPPCLEYGLPQKCENLFKYGHAPLSDGAGLNGCYASHILLRPGTHIVVVPDSLADEVVAPANCALATMVNAVSRLPDPCRSVVVQGAGLLGLYACALLRGRGVENVFVVEVQEGRLEAIAAFRGIAIDGRPEHYPQGREKILALAAGGVDTVLEVAGEASLIPEGVSLLRPGGFYGFVGMVHPQTRLDLTGEQVIRKCLTIYGVHNYAPWHLDRAINFLQQTYGEYPYESLVSPPFPLAELENALSESQAKKWGRVSVRHTGI